MLAIWDGEASTEYGLVYRDPRLSALGLRVLLPPNLEAEAIADLGAQRAQESDYDAHRIALGVPRGGLDFIYGDAFPHDADMDQLGGVDFAKGCFVGQEVVSRVEHRGTARTRVVPVAFDDYAADAGVPVMAGDKSIGVMGSSAGREGLALLRLDRAQEAVAGGTPLTAGGIALRLRPSTFAKAAAKASAMKSALLHPDGLHRCPWPKTDPLYIAYHDTEWGVPEYDDRALFEKLVLDGFQAGLSWITILRKRDNFRRAFDDFDPHKIARYNSRRRSKA